MATTATQLPGKLPKATSGGAGGNGTTIKVSSLDDSAWTLSIADTKDLLPEQD